MGKGGVNIRRNRHCIECTLMQNLNRLLQFAQAASLITDLTRQKHTHVLPADAHATVYIHADDAVLRVVRWDRKQVEAAIETRPPIGWRVETDYDENGVYIVVMRRAGFRAVAKATLNVLVPRAAHLVLRLNNGMVSLDHVRGTLYIDPPTSDDASGHYLADGINN